MNSKLASRVSIHDISLEDASFFLELLNTESWLRFIGDSGVRCIADAEAFIEDRIFGTLASEGFTYSLARNLAAEPIGICGFLKKPYLENPDFGFGFLPAYQGQGYGYEVANTVLRRGLEEHRFAVLDAVVDASNAASIGLLRKLGFSPVAWVEVPGEREPLRLFKLLNR